MILVTLGTQKQSFARLLEYIENAKIEDTIIVQAGYTDFKSKKMTIFDFINYSDMDKLIEQADIIITHGGTGSIIGPLQRGKKVIACARLAKYGEHVDNHQKEIVTAFNDAGYILELHENNSLNHLITKIKKQKMKKYHSNTDEFIKKLKAEIEK